jgi:hypothetical protein
VAGLHDVVACRSKLGDLGEQVVILERHCELDSCAADGQAVVSGFENNAALCELGDDLLQPPRRNTCRTWLGNGDASNDTADTDIEVRCSHGEFVGSSSGELHAVEDRLADPRVDDGKDVA